MSNCTCRYDPALERHHRPWCAVFNLKGQRSKPEPEPCGHCGHPADWHDEHEGCVGPSGIGGIGADNCTCTCNPNGVDGEMRSADASELTSEEVRSWVSELSIDLYQARDALAFVGECCAIADRDARTITTADVREWLKGARCGRQIAAEAEQSVVCVTEALGLDEQRAQLLDAMSGISEERWSAGWMEGLERRLHAEGGIWETLGRSIGWPTGDYGKWTWVTWEEAAALFASGKERSASDPTICPQCKGPNAYVFAACLSCAHKGPRTEKEKRRECPNHQKAGMGTDRPET